MLKEFRDFIARGNVIDLAVAVIIGAAFGAIVTSLVNDVLMPPIGKVMGGIDFKDYYVVLDRSFATTVDGKALSLADVKAEGVPVIAYGQFINNVVNFLIVAFCVFLLVKLVNKVKKAPPSAVPNTKDCPHCLSTIPLKASRCMNCTASLA